MHNGEFLFVASFYNGFNNGTTDNSINNKCLGGIQRKLLQVNICDTQAKVDLIQT